MNRHSWGEPVRPDHHNTLRTCKKCGLIKITRHEDDNNPRHWIEFEREGRLITARPAPKCEAA